MAVKSKQEELRGGSRAVCMESTRQSVKLMMSEIDSDGEQLQLEMTDVARSLAAARARACSTHMTLLSSRFSELPVECARESREEASRLMSGKPDRLPATDSPLDSTLAQRRLVRIYERNVCMQRKQ